MGLLLRLTKRAVSMFARFILRLKKPRQCLSDLSIWDVGVNERKHLVVGGCDCHDLAKEYGTPLHVVNQSRLIANFHDFRNSFKAYDGGVEVYYSYKTNPVSGVLSLLHQQGAGAEVISSFELWLALKLGVPPGKIIYNGPFKSDESLQVAIDKEIKLLHIDSFDEIDRIRAVAKGLGKVPQVGIRVCSDVGWTHQLGLKISSGEAFEAYRKCAATENLRVCALHLHLGTSLRNPQIYTAAVDAVCAFMKDIRDKLGIEIEYLDVGGGFAVPSVGHLGGYKARFYRWGGYGPPPPNPGDCPTMETFARNIVEHIDEGCRKFNLAKPTLLLEPGRAITSSAQILLVKVSTIKRDRERVKAIIADGGINIAYPATGEYHEVWLASRMNEEREQFYSISGPLCTPADRVYVQKMLPRIQRGDILAIMDSGAYFIPFSNNFSFPRPAVVNAFEGRHRLLRQREAFEDMVGKDKH